MRIIMDFKVSYFWGPSDICYCYVYKKGSDDIHSIQVNAQVAMKTFPREKTKTAIKMFALSVFEEKRNQ